MLPRRTPGATPFHLSRAGAGLAAGLLASAACLWALSSAQSHPAGSDIVACVDLEASRAEVRKLEDDGVAAVVQDVEGEEAHQWIAALNAYPPRTDYEADAMLAAVTDGGGGVVIALFRGGCQVGVGELPADVYLAISEAVDSIRPAT